MTDLITISKKRDNDYPAYKRNIELNRLKIKDIHDIIKQYGIVEIYDQKLPKAKLISGIILYEKMLLKGKQTEINIYIDGQFKPYFVETKNNLIMVTKSGVMNNTQIYYINNSLFFPEKRSDIDRDFKIYYAEKINDKTPFGWIGYMFENRLNLSKDIALCRKVIIFLEALHFYFKIRYLLYLFDYNSDIIRNICFIYFERTLQNFSNINCKLQ